MLGIDDLSPPVRARVNQYLVDQHGDLSDVFRMCEVMFNAGYRLAIANSVEFQDIPQKLMRIEERSVALRTMIERLQSDYDYVEQSAPLVDRTGQPPSWTEEPLPF